MTPRLIKTPSPIQTSFPTVILVTLPAIEAPSVRAALLIMDRFASSNSDRSAGFAPGKVDPRSEEHTSELQSLMRNSYAVFCLKKKNNNTRKKKNSITSEIQLLLVQI